MVYPSTYNPGKEVWMTEHYIDSNTNGNDWNKSMKVAKEIHDCMNSVIVCMVVYKKILWTN